MVNPYPLEAQVYLTRQCNLRCDYCVLTKSCLNELSLSEWKEVFSILDNLGIQSVKLLGGEPTIKDWLEDLIYFVSNHTSIKCVLLSNSHFSNDRMHSLVASGLWGYFASVDSIISRPISPQIIHTDIKASDGYCMLCKLKKMGIPLLGANVVISSDNILEVPETVERLSNEGFWVNLCPVIWGHGNERVSFEYRAPLSSFRLSSSQEVDIQNMIVRLLELKSSGAKIIASESYIQGILTFGIDQNWHCSSLAQLRIDADGRVMCCPDIRGQVSQKYSIFDLKDAKRYKQLIQVDWLKNSSKCPGCYWSSIFLAEENQMNNRSDFWYIKK